MNRDLIEKLREYRNKALSIATVLNMVVTGAALAEDVPEKTDDTSSNVVKFAQYQVFTPLTVEEFENLLDRAYNYLKDKLPNSNLSPEFGRYTQNLECLIYNVNVDYITEDRAFIEATYAYGEDVPNGRLTNLYDASGLIADMQDYNQSLVKLVREGAELQKYDFSNYDKELFHKYLVKVTKNKKYNLADAVTDYNNSVEKKNPEKAVDIDGKACLKYNTGLDEYLAEAIKDKDYDLEEVLNTYIESLYNRVHEALIDPSIFCYNEDDAMILHSAFENWFQANIDIFKGIYPEDSEAYLKVYKQITTLGSVEGVQNINEASTGAEWIGKKIIGVALWNMEIDWAEEVDYERVPRYYDTQTWKPTDFEINPNCHDEFENVILDSKHVRRAAIETVNNKIMTILQGGCKEQEETKGK